MIDYLEILIERSLKHPVESRLRIPIVINFITRNSNTNKEYFFQSTKYTLEEKVFLADVNLLPEDVVRYIDTLLGYSPKLNVRVLDKELFTRVEEYCQMRGEE